MQARRIASILVTGAFIALIAACSLARTAHAGADTGWVIESFRADITINDDASLDIIEIIVVDFGSLDRHGIFRDIPIRYEWPGDQDRIYRFDDVAVGNGEGGRWEYEVIRDVNQVRLKIGDPDRTISGRQTYEIAYRVEGALNAFADHDELFWNVNGGNWDVSTLEAAAVVTLEGGGIDAAICYEGSEGSDARCTGAVLEDETTALYAATRPLAPGEQMTIAAAFPKGAVGEPTPILVDEPENWFERYFKFNPFTIGAAAVVMALGVIALAVRWWRYGRDRVYTSIYYLTQNPEEETRRLGHDEQIVVEYTPPDDLLPAQMGVLLDESADTKDATATIVDLAVRGYLAIEEKEKSWLFGKTDWRLTKKREAGDDLEPYERTILNGLFKGGVDEVDVSDLKNEYYTSLQSAQKQLYTDVTRRKWFAQNPDHARDAAQIAGIVIIALGAGIGWLLGTWFGGALIGVPVAITGALVFLTAGLMPARTAKGSEALRRVLGFRLYIDTAEKSRQDFNEQANIFAKYLPYAIVFGSVEKWARAFRDIDTEAATASWYTGAHAFSAMQFSNNLSSFSTSMSSVIASTPGGSGGSGFSGGGSGGGGGGGGGGSW